MIIQITTRTPQSVAKIIAITLTLAGRVSDLKLDMLEAIDTIAIDGKIYRWADYVSDMVKTICERCQETGGIIKFPSLILWIVMYHICPEGSPVFHEPSRFNMYRFKPFSQKGTLHELEQGKVFLENWFQQLKVHTTRWRVPQNIQQNLPANSHIQLELDHTLVWYMQGEDPKAKALDYYPSVDQIFRELSR